MASEFFSLRVIYIILFLPVCGIRLDVFPTIEQANQRRRRDKANLKRSNDCKLVSSLREKTGRFFPQFFHT